MKESDSAKIGRFINRAEDESDKLWVESQFIDGENNNSLRNMLHKDWDSLLREPSSSEVDLLPVLDRIHHMINKAENERKHTFLRRFSRRYMQVAAILLIPVVVAGGIIFSYLGHQSRVSERQNVSSVIHAPLGARVSFSLPDGTTGMLNSGSKLSYDVPFTGKRRIALVGEAFFSIAKDEKHPFTINAGQSTVTVLGTKFNISAYPTENYVEIVLQEGRVGFLDNSTGKKVHLAASERLVFQGGNISKVITDPAKYSAWTIGRLVFNNDPMAEVARRMERWYNVKIILADKELENYSFRGTFEDEKLEEVLRLLSLTSPISFEISPRKRLSDGTFEKETVIIHMKKRKV